MTHDQPLRILSADAPKAGLRRCAAGFAAQTDAEWQLELTTGPIIRERVGAGEAAADIVVIPRPLLDELAAAGRILPETLGLIGHVTVGVAVRNDAREPDISTVDAFVAAVLAADAVIYNLASSGRYALSVFDKLGLTERIAATSVVVPTGKAVMARLAEDMTGNAIGFGHVTEIRLHDGMGTHLVGPLPGVIGRETPYAVGVVAGSPREGLARRFAAYLATPECRRIFADAGVT